MSRIQVKVRIQDNFNKSNLNTSFGLLDKAHFDNLITQARKRKA